MHAKIVQTVAGHAANGFVKKHLSVRYGWTLMRDRQISGWTKLVALAIGIAALGAIIALELPLETIVAVLMPGVGSVLGLFVDGLELIALPVIVGCLVLPKIAKPVR